MGSFPARRMRVVKSCSCEIFEVRFELALPAWRGEAAGVGGRLAAQPLDDTRTPRRLVWHRDWRTFWDHRVAGAASASHSQPLLEVESSHQNPCAARGHLQLGKRQLGAAFSEQARHRSFQILHPVTGKREIVESGNLERGAVRRPMSQVGERAYSCPTAPLASGCTPCQDLDLIVIQGLADMRLLSGPTKGIIDSIPILHDPYWSPICCRIARCRCAGILALEEFRLEPIS